MEEIEVPIENAQETIHEHAHHQTTSWVGKVALSSALLAVLAAIAALLSGHHANEAMIEQIKSSDSWNYYQAKGIKASILTTKIQMLEAMGKEVKEEDKEKAKDYKKEQDEITEKAKEFETSSEAHLARHQTFAKSVTFFQVAIAISAISVLVKRRRFWYLSLVFGLVGVAFLGLGFI